MPFYKVNMMGGFRVADREQVLQEGRVYPFSEEEISESRGLTAALRSRWLIETDKDGRPASKAEPRKPAASRRRPPAEEADMYPDGEVKDEEAELDRVNAEETALHFDSELEPPDLDTVATPSGPVGPKSPAKAKKQRPKARKTKARKPKARKKPRRRRPES